MSNIENITNNNYRLLSFLFDNTDKSNSVRVTKKEMCDNLDLTRNTIVGILENLKKYGYIVQDDSYTSKYYITDLGLKIIENVRRIEE